MRELCAGMNVDLGMAAVFRDQWAREATTTPATLTAESIAPPTQSTTSLTLVTLQAPGDAVAMTAAIYSLHRAYPGKYTTAVRSLWPDVFRYNPDVVHDTRAGTEIQMSYPAIHAANDRGIHFMQGWCEFLGTVLSIHIPLLTNRPRIYFAEPDPPTEDYWVICSGGKRDFTCKLWGDYQQVVNQLEGKVRFIQVGLDQPRLRGTQDKIGRTSLRGLFDIVRRSRGVLCGVSLLMHVAAALEKPAVVVAGGREPVQWNAYPRQHYVHTIGMLPCRSIQGHVGEACWKSRVVPLGDDSFFDKNLCERPVNGFPECMSLIKPEEVAALVMRYNRV